MRQSLALSQSQNCRSSVPERAGFKFRSVAGFVVLGTDQNLLVQCHSVGVDARSNDRTGQLSCCFAIANDFHATHKYVVHTD